METNDLKGAKILVIGGAGLIGSHVVDELVKEDVGEIAIYDNFSRGSYDNIEQSLKDPRVKVFGLGGDVLHTDILNEAIKGKDYVFHLAALWLLHCHDYPRSAFKVNIEGTFNVLEACVQHKVKKLVYSSSASVYGDAVSLPMTEEHPYNNKTFYGATKIAGEHMCRAFYCRYGLNYSGLRYMNVYGARQDYKGAYIAVIMKILDRLDQGLPPIVYGDGTQAYDFIYVSDVARANICALKSAATDAFYNVGSGIQTSLKELAELILKVTGKDLKIQYEPAGQTFVKNRIGDPKKAKEEIGFETIVTLADGLQQLIEWRNAHKELVEKRRLKG
ncbi:MAG: NAD-dependent epimerase/dehydratase family protein [bacterium]|nr:NAD-dependent epimerase/dehydratase family protein [bacterium]MDD5353804.1 NAD-dependent epimerase/dehydratase family protein [bacterium]MDD5756176.1 NAD-dependent epimerase/dehydratase family protein [bacterium]